MAFGTLLQESGSGTKGMEKNILILDPGLPLTGWLLHYEWLNLSRPQLEKAVYRLENCLNKPSLPDTLRKEK